MSQKNGNVAATCPVSRSQIPPAIRRQPAGVDVAAIPRAHDLRSVINAINQMTTVITQITRGNPQVNNVYVLAPGQSGGGYVVLDEGSQNPRPQYDQPNWVESGREYVDSEVINPDDNTQKIKIKRLKFVMFQDQLTGYQMKYQVDPQ